MKIILVTGGSGLVGKAIQKISNLYPNYKFLFANSKELDLRCLDATWDYFQRIKPDFVIHLAANVGGLFKNMKYGATMLEDNLLINMNILACCREFKVTKVVSCLSTCIFPDLVDSYPINETMLHQGPPHFSNEGYAYAKRFLDIQSRAHRKQYGCNFITVIPTNIYGPNDNFNLEDGHVLPALIHRCHKSIKENKPFEIKGTGKPLRQFIYSEDLAYLLLWALENYEEENPIILCPDQEDEISIAQTAKLVADAMNYEKSIEFNIEASDGQYRKTVSNQKLRKYLPDYKFTDIKSGIEKTAKWFLENYETARK